MGKLSVIIPAHNEEKTVAKLLDLLFSVKLPRGFELEVIAVEDGSTDSTWSILQKLASQSKQLRAIRNKKNLGKSQTVKRGVMMSTGDWVVVQDADLEYVPGEIRTLLDLALQEGLDFVYGNRFHPDNKILYAHFYLGNKLLSFISNLFTFPRLMKAIPDMQVCYKLMRGDIARGIFAQLESVSSFGLEPEVTARLARIRKGGKRLRFGVLPITYKPRTIEQGKHINVKDGLKAVIEIIRFNIF